jgi:membrane-associated phospholipid phosphatase
MIRGTIRANPATTRTSTLPRGRLTPTDWTVVLYLSAVLALVLAAPARPSAWGWIAAAHVLLIAAVRWVARADRREPGAPAGFLHLWLPILLVSWFYWDAGAFRHLIFPRDFDPLVAAWDARIFPRCLQGLWATVPPRLPVAILEALHAAYFSFYLLLFVPALAIRRREPREVEESVFVLILCFLTHFAFSLAFPVSGPVPLRAEVMPRGVLFIPLMDRLYAAYDPGGVSFPSTHAAAAVIAGWHAVRWFPRWRFAFAAQVALILAATVLCTFHYTVDTVLGAVTGALVLAAGRWLWPRISLKAAA